LWKASAAERTALILFFVGWSIVICAQPRAGFLAGGLPVGFDSVAE
jgi:hypothetical protein